MIGLDVIRDCLEGVVPGAVATCDENGVPNVSLLSQVHYVDTERVALSFQFFNKTRANVLATRRASVLVVDPVTVEKYRLELEYEETQESGPLFEVMKAKLAGIASHAGMAGVFRLRGADVYRVRSVERLPGQVEPAKPKPRNLLSAARRTFTDIADCTDLGQLLDVALESLARHFGIDHAMILIFDEAERRLFTTATRGYAASGIGSEVNLGEGVIGVAARERVPIRIAHMTSDYRYGASIRDQARGHDDGWAAATEIPFPGLEAPGSQIALPLLSRDRLSGVLFAESPEPLSFWYDDEDALSLVADRLGALIVEVQRADPGQRPSGAVQVLPEEAKSIVLRHYDADDSIFVGHDYLIKGVAGAILWKLASEMVLSGRTDFTNRELRLDPALRLPEHTENLEARLVLLQRRLCERKTPIRIEKTGRGRFRLCVRAGLLLENVAAGGARTSA